MLLVVSYFWVRFNLNTISDTYKAIPRKILFKKCYQFFIKTYVLAIFIIRYLSLLHAESDKIRVKSQDIHTNSTAHTDICIRLL